MVKYHMPTLRRSILVLFSRPQLELLKAALEFYADPNNYEGKGGEDLFSDVLCDGGSKAAVTLKACPSIFEALGDDGK